MSKLWEGRTSGEVDDLANALNKSISIDKRLYKEDIEGSIAHVKMLAKQNIISDDEAKKLVEALDNLKCDIENGKVIIDEDMEDIHSFVELKLTEKLGSIGKKVHTARSRNDQVALDIRLYLKKQIDEKISLIKELINVSLDKAEENEDTIMPGYTHMQRAQAINYGHSLLAYASMFLRDIERLTDAKKRVDVSPIGSGALAGTTFNIDREYEAKLLGFSKVCVNSIDGVSDRDFIIEILSDLSIMMMHLSRFAEEIILYQSMEFSFIDLDNRYSTGSSMMPQKKNPDMAELVRGKAGKVYGDLVEMLVTMKSLPLAYNKDMQEDKACIFDALDTVDICIKVFAGMIKTMTVKKDNMAKAVDLGYMNATDVADYLVKKGMAFRDAYKLTGELVNICIGKNITLNELSIDEYKKKSELFDEDIYKEIDNTYIVSKKNSYGGASTLSIEAQIKEIKKCLNNV